MPISAPIPNILPNRTMGTILPVGYLHRPKWLLPLLFSMLPCLAATSIRDVDCSPLDPKTGRVDIAYTVETGTNDAPARLTGVVLDRATGRSLGQATLLGCPAGALAPGRHRVVWNALADAAFRPLNRVELRLFAEPILSEKEEEGENEAGETLPRLLFHCSLDSADAIAACGGTVTAAEYVEGVHGKAVQVGHARDPICFPLENVITNFRKGSVEIWAKILEPDYILSSSASELNLVNLRQVNDDIGNFFRITLTTNNGHGQSGLVGGISIHDKASTHIGRIGPFDIAAAIGGNNPTEWHHYRLSWDADGIGGGNDRTAVFVDNRKVVSSTEPLFDIKPAWDHFRYILKISESNGVQPWAVFDELKLWDGAVVPESPNSSTGFTPPTQLKREDTGKTIYLVIDLSGGPTAEKYPYEIREGVPDGGWTDEYKTTKLVLRYIEPGEFLMGSPQGEFGRDSNETSHLVRLTKPFFIGVFELTQKQWELVTGKNPSRFPGEKRPVEQVSYGMIRGTEVGVQWPRNKGVDSMSFLGLLRIKTGLNSLDIPTEAQWEYACRAGTQTSLNNGTSVRRVDSDPNMLRLGRCSSNWQDGHGDYNQAHTTVGSYEPNAWGLYDMHGNVWEFCRGWYVEDFGTAPQEDPEGPQSGPYHAALRGGCYQVGADLCRSAIRCRGAYTANFDVYSGLRICASAQDEALAAL